MKTILVALDHSSRAASVLDAAIAEAQARNAKLVLFRAIGIPPEMPGMVWQSEAPSLIELLRDAATKELNEHAARVPDTVRSSHLVTVEIGSPWQSICTAAEKENADLVVIGSHGYGFIDRVLGTTAAKVVNHAPCSVLLVRDTKKAT